MKQFFLYVFFYSILWGCTSTPVPQVSTNLNPPPVYLRDLGHFLILLDVKIPKDKIKKAVTEEGFTSRYISDSLSEYINSPSYQAQIIRWKKAPEKKRGGLWKKIRSQTEEFLYQKSQSLNKINRYIKIQKIILGFQGKGG